MTMRNDPLPFNFEADGGGANETSHPIVTGHYWGHGIQIDGTFVANVIVQVRLSQSVGYVDLQTVSSKSLISIGHPIESVRLKIEDYESGTVVGMYAGYKVR
jgi:hypothetical protein